MTLIPWKGTSKLPKTILFRWQDGANDPCQTFTGEQAEQYCQLAGGHAVSLDSNEKVTFFFDKLSHFYRENIYAA